jgi:hypothetical protein
MQMHQPLSSMYDLTMINFLGFLKLPHNNRWCIIVVDNLKQHPFQKQQLPLASTSRFQPILELSTLHISPFASNSFGTWSCQKRDHFHSQLGLETCPRFISNHELILRWTKIVWNYVMQNIQYTHTHPRECTWEKMHLRSFGGWPLSCHRVKYECFPGPRLFTAVIPHFCKIQFHQSRFWAQM